MRQQSIEQNEFNITDYQILAINTIPYLNFQTTISALFFIKQKYIIIKYAKEFIHQKSIGNKEECFEIGKAWVAQMKNWKSEGKIKAWEGRIVHNKKGIDESLIFFDYETLTQGIFPFVYFVVQITAEYESAISDYLTKANYLEIDTENLDFRKSLG